jgi:PAS domain S-box-containing protein
MIPELSPYSVALLVIGVESITLTLIIWRRSHGKRGVIPFTLMMSGLAIWSLAYAIEIMVPDLPGKLLWTRIEYLGIVSIPVTAFLFCVDYTGVDRWLSRQNVILVSIMPLVTILMLSTNDLHHLFYTRVGLVPIGQYTELDVSHGPWFWIHAAYSYLLMLFGIGLLARALVRSPELYRGQLVTLLAGMLAPWIGNAVYISGLSPLANLDITPFFFALTGLMAALSLVRYHLLDIIPAARDMVIESMHEAVIVLDMERRVVDLNPAARTILGTASHGAIGKNIQEVLPQQKDLIERFRDKIEASAEVTLPIRGEDRTLELRVSTLSNRGGIPTGRLIVIRDISEAKLIEKNLAEARDQALEALRLRSRILAVVSHELRTPLSAILGYADMLKVEAHGPMNEAQRSALGRVIANATHLTELVNDLLDQAQMEQRKVTLHIVPSAPARLMEIVEVAMSHQARANGMKLVTEVSSGAPEVIHTDLARLAQVVNNLVGNALKFSSEGEVKVRLYRVDDSQWAISVSDKGPGISPENQALIFEPFWQVDKPETREHQGVGLGLSIAKQMTQLLGGEIKLDSALGKGTTFTVLFPSSPLKEKAKGVEDVSGVRH